MSVETAGGFCARGDEPMRSVEVTNFLISLEALSSEFHVVINLVMMNCVCVCVCVCVCDIVVPVSAIRVFLVRYDWGLYSVLATGYHATRFIS